MNNVVFISVNKHSHGAVSVVPHLPQENLYHIVDVSSPSFNDPRSGKFSGVLFSPVMLWYQCIFHNKK